jgi:hypothetical protein
MIVERVMPAAAVAHELSVVLPHVEVRRTRDPSRPEAMQEEVVIESITVVSSPMRRAADEAGRGIPGRGSKIAR